MKNKAYAVTAITICTVLLICIAQSAAASPTVELSLTKNNGYDMGNDMNGDWTLNAEVSSDVTRVEFFIDGHLVANDTQAPYNWRFDTFNYTAGLHLFRAVASNAQGEFGYQEAPRNFVPFPLDWVVGIVALVIVTLVIALVGAVVRAKKLGVKLRK